MNTAGSDDFTPNRKLAIKRVSPKAAAMPMATPISARAMPWKTTIPRTWPVSAPSAMRIPISCVRCFTA
jgi:hypothetical protein